MATTRGSVLRLGLVATGVVLTVAGVTRLTGPAGSDFGAPAAAVSTTAVVAATSAGGVGAPAGSATASPPAPEPAAALPTDVAASGAGAAPGALASPDVAAPAATTASGGATPLVPAEVPVPDRPVEVRFDRLGVSAEIDGVLSVDGVLQVPDDPERVGWWIASSMPGGDVGTTVLDGHLDSATRGVGFFVHLRELDDGDSITVTTASGGTVVYAVEARQTYPKAAPLPAALFDRGGAPALVLVTCGGQFDDARGSYQDNIVVTARPV